MAHQRSSMTLTVVAAELGLSVSRASLLDARARQGRGRAKDQRPDPEGRVEGGLKTKDLTPKADPEGAKAKV